MSNEQITTKKQMPVSNLADVAGEEGKPMTAGKDPQLKKYRINPCDPKLVQCLYDGMWQTSYYCGSIEGAKDCLARCLKRQEDLQLMTQEERRKAILRGINRFTCFDCGCRTAIADPDEPKNTLCPDCCGVREGGHDFQYDRNERKRLCTRCDIEIPQEYYDGE